MDNPKSSDVSVVAILVLAPLFIGVILGQWIGYSAGYDAGHAVGYIDGYTKMWDSYADLALLVLKGMAN